MDPIVESFLERVQRAPHAPIVIAPGRQTSALEVDRRAREWERELAQAALERHVPIGLVAPNGADFLAAFIALRRLGHPIVLIDFSTPDDERQRICERLEAAGFVTPEQGALAWTPAASGGTPRASEVCAFNSALPLATPAPPDSFANMLANLRRVAKPSMSQATRATSLGWKSLMVKCCCAN